jgi:hypothetical protein
VDTDIDISRGDLMAADKARPVLAEQFAAHLIGMGNQPLLPGRARTPRSEAFGGPCNAAAKSERAFGADRERSSSDSKFCPSRRRGSRPTRSIAR